MGEHLESAAHSYLLSKALRGSETEVAVMWSQHPTTPGPLHICQVVGLVWVFCGLHVCLLAHGVPLVVSCCVSVGDSNPNPLHRFSWRSTLFP